MLFFMDGAQSHGTHPWQNDHDRRSILFKYASRTATRQGPSNAVCHPEVFWDHEIVDGMSMAERAVMYGPCSAPPNDEMFLVVEDDGAVSAGEYARATGCGLGRGEKFFAHCCRAGLKPALFLFRVLIGEDDKVGKVDVSIPVEVKVTLIANVASVQAKVLDE